MKRFFIVISLLAMVFGFSAFQCSSSELTSARLYIQQENYDKAKEVLESEVEKNPQSAEGLYLLGYIYGEEGDIGKMVEYFDKSLAVSDEYKQSIIDNRNYHWANNFNQGVAYFNKAAEATNEDSTKMLFDTAIEKFQNAILAQPDSIDTYKNLTFALINAGRTDEAVEPLKKLVNKEGTADSYAMLGEIYVRQGQALINKYRESGNVQDSVKAIDIYDKAIDLLKVGREKYPQNGDILLYLSNAYINASKLDVAMEAFKQGVEQEPNNKYYRYNYGVLLLESEDYAEAIKQFKVAVELDPDYSNAIYNLAATYVKWGTELRDEAEANETGDESYKEKFEMALPYLEKYLELNPEDDVMWDLLGRVYANLGMNEKSMEAFDKADQLK